MGRLTPLRIWRDQNNVLPKSAADLSGRTVVVVGSNTGIGLEAARRFAELKASRLILAVRNVEKGAAAKGRIVASTSIRDAAVEVWALDLASIESVLAFATRARNELDRLDVLLLNAGIGRLAWSKTGDGYESMLQVNIISSGLLAILLLPLLQKAAKLPPSISTASDIKPHITFTTSMGHHVPYFREHTDPHPVQALEKNYGTFAAMVDRYDTTKLLQVLIARELAQIADSGVVVNTANPGFCRSEFFRDVPMYFKLLVTALNPVLARTCEVGSRAVVWGALNDTPPGAYTSNCQVEEESDFALSQAGRDAQKRVWADLREIWSKVAPEARASL